MHATRRFTTTTPITITIRVFSHTPDVLAKFRQDHPSARALATYIVSHKKELSHHHSQLPVTAHACCRIFQNSFTRLQICNKSVAKYFNHTPNASLLSWMSENWNACAAQFSDQFKDMLVLSSQAVAGVAPWCAELSGHEQHSVPSAVEDVSLWQHNQSYYIVLKFHRAFTDIPLFILFIYLKTSKNI